MVPNQEIGTCSLLPEIWSGIQDGLRQICSSMDHMRRSTDFVLMVMIEDFVVVENAFKMSRCHLDISFNVVL
jgi:hypothetical protein